MATTGGGSVLLENCIDSLQLLGFEVYPKNSDFVKAGDTVGDKYIIRSYPHDTIWGDNW